MAGSLFYSVPTIDHDDEEDEEDDDINLHQEYNSRRRSDNIRPTQNELYMPDYASDTDSDDRDHSDSSTQSPPMSLFLDRTHQHIEDDEAPLVSQSA
jgi:hypothetical protein